MKENIIGKAMAGLLFLLAVLGALIFISAGTADYLQGWLYLLTFGVSTTYVTLYLYKNDQELLKRRTKAGATAEKETNQKIIQSVASIAFCLVYVVAGLDFRFSWSGIPVFISVMADFLVAAGFYIVFLVFRENSFTSAVIEVNENQKVISTGPYAVVRHPMYSGASLMMLSSAVALASYWALICVSLLIIVIIFRLLDEENYLRKNLSGYPEYCEKVRYHLIPYLW